VRPYDIIIKKRNGGKLTSEEIRFIVDGFTAGTVANEQMAAFMMSVYFKDMDGEETAVLVECMMNSGKIIDLSDIQGIKVDKHSTGGVGDKVSLVLAPLVAAWGVPVPMMSGRGLGHTGGTLDKLESFTGYRWQLTEDEYRQQVADIGVAIIGQTADIAPADGKMYAMRDVTATVDSIPLITGSIMSKKLAAGPDALIMDVKTGQGAFMQTVDDALSLAQSMVSIGVPMGRTVEALITDMNQPLGRAVGNALEMRETLESLRGEGPADLMEVTRYLGGRMLVMAGKAKDWEEGRTMIDQKVESGEGLKKFKQMIAAQGGSTASFEDYSAFPSASHIVEITSPKDGYIQDINALQVGLAACSMGAGRVSQDSIIDLAVGIIMKAKVGNKVSVGSPLGVLHANSKESAEVAGKQFVEAFTVGAERPAPRSLIFKHVTSDEVFDLNIPNPTF
jgi:pyrimidine-nucleoside phosphorylase